jgi:lipopolysaccharide O-acetyltransferase
MSKFNLLQRFWRENGTYLTLCKMVESPFYRLRNRILARRFKVKSIQIGSGAQLRGLFAIRMGEKFASGDGLWLEAITCFRDQVFSPRIIIGDNVTLSRGNHIAATCHVEIGDGVVIGSGVFITDHNHGHYGTKHSSPLIPPALRTLDCDRSVIIGRNVWIGDGVVVCPGSHVGEGSVIGANSVVTGLIPPFTIAAGVPARPLKTYDFDNSEWVKVR